MTFALYAADHVETLQGVRDATARGFSRRINAEGGNYELSLMVRPDADLDGTFEAYDLDEGDFITVNGWLFVIEPCD